jgi:hypothetical protein
MDSQRNHLMTLSLRLTMMSVALSFSSLGAGLFGAWHRRVMQNGCLEPCNTMPQAAAPSPRRLCSACVGGPASSRVGGQCSLA